MIIGRERTSDWPADLHFDEERRSLAPQRADDHVDFRRAQVAGTAARNLGDPGNGAITDEEILDAAYSALHNSGYGQLRNVLVDCEDGRVTLHGQVPTYELKLAAQSAIDRVAGIRCVNNDLQVVTPR